MLAYVQKKTDNHYLILTENKVFHKIKIEDNHICNKLENLFQRGTLFNFNPVSLEIVSERSAGKKESLFRREFNLRKEYQLLAFLNRDSDNDGSIDIHDADDLDSNIQDVHHLEKRKNIDKTLNERIESLLNQTRQSEKADKKREISR